MSDEKPRTILSESVLKIIFGFALLLVLALLASVIALGKVEQQTSFGLQTILGGLLTLSGGFAGWAFRDSGEQAKSSLQSQSSATEVHPSVDTTSAGKTGGY